MEQSLDGASTPPLVRQPPKIRINKQLESVKQQTESDYQVSPSTPLLSTSIDENGWVCGQNISGQLGVGGTSEVLEPQPLQVAKRWAALSFGGSHAAGVSGEGEVFTWGCNDKGQLGQPAGEHKDIPKRMDILRGWDVRAIACGGEHTVAITPEDVISWGSNDQGQAGQGERAEVEWVKPRSIKPLQGVFVTQVACGRSHTLCVTATSQVFAWGLNSSGQLGLGDTANRRAPALVDALWAMPVQQLAAGDSHSAALTSSGFLFTWGGNDRGQLGVPTTAEAAASSAAQRTLSERKRAKRKVNQRFLSAMLDMGIPPEKAELALSETGNVGIEVAAEWLFSVPDHVLEKHLNSAPDTPEAPAEEPTQESRRLLTPRRVPLQCVRFVGAGAQHTVAVTDDKVYAWGANHAGQLGTRTFRDKAAPAEAAELADVGVCQVACGTEHTLFLCRDGSVWGCGTTAHGELPYLKYGPGSPSSSAGESAHEDEPSTSREEVATPTKLRLRFLASRGRGNASANSRAAVVSQVVAGGHGSAFLTRAPEEFPALTQGPQLWERLQACVGAARQEAQEESGKDVGRVGPSARHLKPIVNAVEMVFASAAALSAAFGYRDRVGIDVQMLEEMQTTILGLYRIPGSNLADSIAEAAATPLQKDPRPKAKSEAEGLAGVQESISGLCFHQINSSMYKAANHLLDDLQRNVRLLGAPERAQVLLCAAQNPLMSEKKCAQVLIPRLCTIILNAPSSARHLLVKWWSEYDAELLERRVVAPLQSYLTAELFVTKKLTVAVMNVIKVLAKVEEANQLGRVLPPEAFYNELISEKLDVEDHYVAWRQTHDQPRHDLGNDGPFSFCSYPFLLNPRAKSKLLHTEARFLMTQTVHQARIEQVQNGAAGARRRSTDDRVLPDEKRALRGREAAAAREREEARERERKEKRRREKANGLRGLWHTMWRNAADGGEGSSLSVDERQMVAREMSSSRNVSPTAAASRDPLAEAQGGGRLQRQGSMNLPTPEESGVPATHPDMCILRIRRNHLMEDALDEIARQKPRDLFKPLRVHFIGEEGIDAGGVKKEFFQLLVTELLSPDYGMLLYQAESRTYWFNPSTLESDNEFLLIGLVLGLAIYNAVLLDFPLPLALYRKLIGQPCTLRDLADMQPTLGKSLTQLLDYEGPGSVEDTFCQNFTAGVPGIGEVLIVPLREDGEEVMVTEENRREYVDAYTNYYLNSSVERQFEAFAKGFMTLCGGPAIHLFSATELERLVCGNPILDFEAMQANARYDGGYNAEHRAVKWLWEIVRGFDEEEKRRFLKFFTGSDRAPIGGLGNLRCIIQRDGTDTSKLPTSHTCFNTLLLPSYKTREKMADRLKLAIMNAEGFGLE